jgi:methylglyoxal synthase
MTESPYAPLALKRSWKDEFRTIALIAHDKKKEVLADWACAYQTALARHDIVATGTTGQILGERCPTLRINRMKSGPLGGDQQIGALIAMGQVHMLIFFTDPLSPHPHDVDVKALSRLATVYDLPMACSPATATALAMALLL